MDVDPPGTAQLLPSPAAATVSASAIVISPSATASVASTGTLVTHSSAVSNISSNIAPLPAVGGRGVKRIRDGVIYTDSRKRLAVFWCFGQEQAGSVASRAKKLGVGVPTLYTWKKTHDQGIDSAHIPTPGSALAEELASMRSRSSPSNLAIFLKPHDATSLAEEPGGGRSLSSTANTTLGPRFERADGLGPHAENEETFGASGPGVLPPELVEQLRSRSDTATIAASAPSSSASAAPVPSSSASVSVSASGNGSDGMEVDDDRGEEGRDSQGNVDEVLVSEQKLVTYLNCFVLHRNPKFSDEGLDTHVKAVVNLWETQVLKGVNTFPHPRNGALLKAFMKAVRRHRVQHSELLGEDAWRPSLNDGYTEDQHLEINGDDNTAGSDGITWGDQAQILKKAFSDLDIATSKVTHAMRGGGARMAFERGCSEDSIRKQGRWTAGGDQLIERYLTGVALQPVRALAGFSPSGGDYWLPRTLKEPPLSLQQQLWPRIEEAEAAI
ncbi:unnamed protein product [Tilletia caries]|nr:unnamed protein product [Tilletia caries]